MKPRFVILVWLALLALLAAQFALGARLAPFAAAAMALLVALTYMRLARAPGLPAVFAGAAVFWIVVLFGLGSMDVATRHDIGVTNAVPP